MKIRFDRRRCLVALFCAALLLLSACSASAGPADAGTVTREAASSGETSAEMPGGSVAPAENSGTPGPEDEPGTGSEAPVYDAEYFGVERSSSPISGSKYSTADKGSDIGSVSGTGSEAGTVLPGPTGSDEKPAAPGTPEQAAGLVLTAAEWNDNSNWPFFTNLVTAETIDFPSFGVDPRNRILVSVQDEAGAPLPNERVTLQAEDGTVLWTTRSDHEGKAYLFFREGQTPVCAVCGEVSAPVQIRYDGAAQGAKVTRQLEELTITTVPSVPRPEGLQIMFIVDTTGSMSDELAFLQKDFIAITNRIQARNVSYCACFYRDEGDDYVTRVGSFTSDPEQVRAKIAAEYADGGGDEPEAVDQILTETLTDFDGWQENTVKLAFLIFDAPPHEGTDARLTAAIRSAAERGVRLIPVVASNANRDTELFGRAAAICTGGTYVFLTDDSGVGNSHLEPIVGDFEVKLLQDLIVEIVARYQSPEA